MSTQLAIALLFAIVLATAVFAAVYEPDGSDD